jgi:hypothetical protein
MLVALASAVVSVWTAVLVWNVGLTILVFLGFAIVPVLNWTVVTGDTGPDFGFFSTDWAGVDFTIDITVILADRIGWGHGVVRKLVVLSDLTDELHAALPVWKTLAQEGVEDGARGVEGLESVFDVKGGEDIVGVTDW